MKADLFQYNQYLEVLRFLIENSPNSGRGVRSQLSKACKCQPSYLTRVLDGAANFSLEQGEACSQFFNLDSLETHFCLLLLQMERSGTESLRSYFSTQIEEARSRRFNLRDRLGRKEELSEKEKAIYYSNWTYSAIHILTSLPRIKTSEDIAAWLALSKEAVDEVLEFLIRIDMVSDKSGQLEAGRRKMYVGTESVYLNKHHWNWRQKAVDSQMRQVRSSDQVHYTAVFTISEKDAKKIHHSLVKLIDNLEKVVPASDDEQLYALCLDWFNS
ncbi:DUF4423 domain-containing protein [Oligoflexaceae bacterium]|nr:DUF4423 domain-containing protein [Oligoflexaceae bacterium]